MKQATTKELFDFIGKRVSAVGNINGIPPFRAFPRWFAEMYYSHPEEMFTSDGAGDGKVDFFFTQFLATLLRSTSSIVSLPRSTIKRHRLAFMMKCSRSTSCSTLHRVATSSLN